jgi:1,4-dihydroxy-2-naphthoyl-CoA synthase
MVPFGKHDMDKFTTITVEQRDVVEILSLNRPDALNAVTPAMADELITYFSGLHDRLSTRIVIFRGNGRASAPEPNSGRTRSPHQEQDGRNGSSTCSSATRVSSG